MCCFVYGYYGCGEFCMCLACFGVMLYVRCSLFSFKTLTSGSGSAVMYVFVLECYGGFIYLFFY